MSASSTFEQTVFINASATSVERCITEADMMRQWLNPALSCESVGRWSTETGSQFDFRLNIPWLAPSLRATVVERRPGLIVWGFEGFFVGRDRWECQPKDRGTLLLNRFEFSIPNPVVRFGFRQFASTWTKKDMEEQLQRIKQIAERNYQFAHST